MATPVISKNLFNYKPLGRMLDEVIKTDLAMQTPEAVEQMKEMGEILSKPLDDNEACMATAFKLIRPMETIMCSVQAAQKQYVDACSESQLTVPIRDDNDAEVNVFMYTPHEKANETERACMIYAHGGGGLGGSTQGFKGMICEMAVKCGLVLFGVDYRLGPETRHPKNILDFYCAIKHISEKADSLGIDSSRISICGESGGGWICFGGMLMLAKNSEGHLVKLAMPSVAMIDDCVSITPEERIEQELVQLPLQQRIWRCLAPNFQIDYNDDLMFPLKATDDVLSKVPPTIILEKEFDIMITAATKMAERLRKVGRLLEFVVHPGQTHSSNFTSGTSMSDMFMNDLTLAVKEYLL